MSRPKRMTAKVDKKRKATNVEVAEVSNSKPATKRHKRDSSLKPAAAVPQKRAKVDIPSQTTETNRTPGALYTFGTNIAGQIALNPDTVEKRKFPAVCEFLGAKNEKVVAVAAGGMHSVVLTQAGTVYTFGCNDEGGLGRPIDDDNAEEESSEPGTVTLPAKAVSISAGSSHSAALLEDGTLFLWGTFRDGNGHYGLLPGDGADGNSLCHTAPIKIALESNIRIKSIASGNDHMVLLTTTGSVFTFGSLVEVLGRPFRRTRKYDAIDDKTMFLTPKEVAVPGRKKFDAIWCGGSCTFLREATNGTIWSFGMNAQKQLGLENINQNMVEGPTKTTAVTEKNFAHIDVGEFHCLGLTTDGKVFAWGKAHDGQLGLGDDIIGKSPVAIPQHVSALTERAIGINCGHSVSYAWTKSKLYSWGFGVNWQLGKRDDVDSVTPRLVLASVHGKPAHGVFAVSSGAQHTLIVAEKGLGQEETAMDTS